MTKRVIITDGGDYCVFEWQFGKGIVWPYRPAKNGEGLNNNEVGK
jgi:hypothetical protein